MAAGLAQLVDYLTTLRFDPDELAWLAASGRFDAAFVDSLADLAFTGDVDAMPEGTVFFADEPIVRITAPLREAQLVESRAINLLHFETLVASKAVALRAGGARARCWSTSACAARTAPKPGCCRRGRRYLAGFSGTATVAAGRAFGIPVFGTMAHSYVQAHADEASAFEALRARAARATRRC